MRACKSDAPNNGLNPERTEGPNTLNRLQIKSGMFQEFCMMN